MRTPLPIEIKSKHSAALYRKLLLAYLIEKKSEVNLTVLAKETGWPKRTIQDSVADFKSVSIKVSYVGSYKKGFYQIDDWGVFNKERVFENIETIKAALSQYLEE